MLDRIRGKPKDDEVAMEALRRRTAARLAAIVGISVEADPEEDLGSEDSIDDPEAAAQALAADLGDDEASTSGPIEAGPGGPLEDPIVDDGPDVPTGVRPGSAPEPESVPAAAVSDVPQGGSEAVAAVVAASDASSETVLPEAPAGIAAPAIDEDAPLASARVVERRMTAAPVTLPAAIVPVMATPETPKPAARPVSISRAGARARTAKPMPAPVAPAAPSNGSAPTPARATPAKSPAAAKGRKVRRQGTTLLPAACPSCGALLEEVPSVNRRCVECRKRIVVRRLDGRVVLLAEDVAPFFDAERRRLANAERIKREAGRWLQMAALVGAAPEVLEARARTVAARPTVEAVTTARALYATTVERACRAARQAHDWRTLSELRFRQARVYHRAAASTVPPDPAVVALHREAIDASLRAIGEMALEAELVGGACCDTCGTASGRVVRVTAERKSPSVPHADCPAGLCGCRWDIPSRLRAQAMKGPRGRAPARTAAKTARSRD